MKPSSFGEMMRGGTRFAALLSSALALPAMGCLVTNKIDFSETEVRASVTIVQPALTFSRVPPGPEPLCNSDGDAGDDQAVRFAVNVTDANIEEKLSAKITVNGTVSDDLYQITIPPTGGPSRGVVPFCVPRYRLNSPCNRVEVTVWSGDFAGDQDKASVMWWVLPPADVLANASEADCLSDGGMP